MPRFATTPARDWAAALGLAIVGLFGLLFVFITPPFQVPDEVAHYWRSAAIAHGELGATMLRGRSNVFVPAGIKAFGIAANVSTAGRPDVKVGMDRIRAAARLPLDREHLIDTICPAQYTPIPHLPGAVAIAFCNLFQARPVVSFYAGRLLTFVTFFALVLAAARRLVDPFPCIAVCLLPMTLFMAASFSPDAVTIGLAVLVSAMAVSWNDGERRLPIVLCALLALCKPAYLLLSLPVAFRCWRRKDVRTSASIVAVSIAGAFVSAWVVHRNYYAMHLGTATDPRAQLELVLKHPTCFSSVVVHDYIAHASMYLEECVGRLGWLDLFLDAGKRHVVVVLFAVVSILSTPQIDRLTRVASLVAVAGTLVLISLSQYMAWTAVGAPAIEGIQGRYFLPLLPLATLCSCAGFRLQPPWKAFVLVAFTLAACVLDYSAVIAVVHRYY